MSVQFTGDEIIEMAVKTEETGYDFYSLAKSHAHSPKLKDLFGYLAGEEMKHLKLYEGLKGAVGEKAQGLPVDWKDVGMYIQAMLDSSLFFGGDKNINLASKAADEKQAVEFAIGFEKDTLLFFHEVLEVVKTVNRPTVEKIIKQEKEHIRKLVEIRKTL